MTEAYDAALVQLGISGDDARSGEIAAALAMLANDGERDPRALCTKAMESLNLSPTQDVVGGNSVSA